MSEFTKVAQGRQFPRSAGLINGLIDAARAVRQAHQAGPAVWFPPADRFQIWNQTGSDLPPLRILGVASPVFDPNASPLADEAFLREPLMSVVMPTNEYRGRFCVTEEPIAAGELGYARASGLVIVNVADDVDAGDWVDIDTAGRIADNVLDWVPHGSGFVIQASFSAALAGDTKRALVRLCNFPGVQKLCGRLTTDLAAATDSELAPSGGTVELLLGHPAAWSGRTIGIINRSLDLSADAGTYVNLGYQAHLKEWQPDWADCGPPEGSEE